MKPRMFVGSSVESVNVAELVRNRLKKRYDVVLWNKNVFRPGEGFLDSLLRTADQCNFGVFVFAPDDLVSSRGGRGRAVRDNVVFECGMFFGRLRRHRSFFLVPRDVKSLRLPTDLSGVSPAYYVRGSSGTTLPKAIDQACAEIDEVVGEELHRNAISLTGKWEQTWSLPRMSFFPRVNSSHAKVLHIGDQFLASCADPLHPFDVKGTLEQGFITGTWGHPGKVLGYFGSFQIKANPRGDQLDGMVVGFRCDGGIAKGSWKWKRLAK